MNKAAVETLRRIRAQRVPRVMLTLQSLRRHNNLQPELQPTHRVFLRWAAGSGTGLYDPDAPRRESYHDPLPDAEHKLVDQMVIDSPWHTLLKRWYRTDLDSQVIADEFQISRAQLYIDHKNALWYSRGRLESLGFDVLHCSAHGG